MSKTKKYQNTITREEIDMLNVQMFRGPVHVIDSFEAVAGAVNIIQKHPVIGFDTETKPKFKKGRQNDVALIQLALPEEVFLFRINKTGLTDELISLFENKRIIKAGVAIRDDIRKIRMIRDFHPESFLELQEYSKFFGIESNSLKKLTAIVLGYKISKSQQLSDWEGRFLTPEQKIYAATDAWVSLQIYNSLRNFPDN